MPYLRRMALVNDSELVTDLRTAALVGLLAVLAACGVATQPADGADPALPMFDYSSTPSPARAGPVRPSHTVKTSGTASAGTKPGASGKPPKAGKLPQIPSSQLPVMRGFSYVDLSTDSDPIQLPKVAGRPRIHAEALVGVAKGNTPGWLSTASLELIRMDASLATGPSLDDLATKTATSLASGGPTTSHTVHGVKVLTVSNIEGIGINAAVFRNKNDVVTVFSPHSAATLKIAAAYLAAS
jgi:hypothetical protein